MKHFEFDRIKEVRIVGLEDFELIVDAHQDGDASSVAMWGDEARSVAVLDDDDVITVHGGGADVVRAQRPVAMTGTFVTGYSPIPLIAVPRDPLRIRYGGNGAAPVTIELSLPPGRRVVLRGPFRTVTTAAPRERHGRVHEDVVSSAARRRAKQLLVTAREARRTGSLSEAIRAHSLEQEAARILDPKRRR